MRTILRAIFALVLLLSGGGGDWAQAGSLGQAHESCCCGTPVNMPDSCPCPKPEGNRGSSRSTCSSNPVVVAAATVRRTRGQRRTEPRPEPVSWARGASGSLDATSALSLDPPAGDRDPDPDRAPDRVPELGRHLARLGTFRI